MTSGRKKALLIIGLIFAGFLINAQPAYARPSKSSLISKAYVNGVGECADTTYFKDSVSIYDVYGFDSVTNGGGKGTVKNPNPLEDSFSTSGVDCKTIFSNYIKATVPEYSNSNTGAIGTALGKLGYSGEGSTASGQTCLNISYKGTNNLTEPSQEVCVIVDSNGNLDANEISGANGSFDTSKNVGLYLGHCGDPLGPATLCVAWKDGGVDVDPRDVGQRTTNYTTLSELQEDIEKAADVLRNATPTGNTSVKLFSDVVVNDPISRVSGGSYTQYKYGNSSSANASEILRNYTEYSDWDSAAFTPYEQYWYYMYTLQDFYNVSIDESSCAVTNQEHASSNAVLMQDQEGHMRWCDVTGARENEEATVNIFSDNHFLNNKGGMNDVISALHGLDYFDSSFSGNDLAIMNFTTGEITPTDPDPEEGNVGNSGTENCYGAKGTLGLSWILCPTLTMLSTSLNNIYTDVAKQYLAVEPGLYSMTRTDESGNQVTNETYKAWSTFQTFANIILVIFLLVVIFSQLTGIGIDNYGIKKILPRLIVVAILINLSYLIAQFVIDVSNIVGSGISNILPHVDVSNIGPIESTSVPEKILGISLAGAGVAGVAALFANPALLLGLLLTLVSGLVSLLVMWLILIARKAGVVIAVVISPLAFAAYLLPNTSKLTKSWVNLMKSLILVYPLAALLIGACFFASDLIQTTNSGLIMAAMLLRVVPFLALPTIFKKSLDAFGNLGTKIQGFGQTLSRGTTGAIRNADWYKNLQERGVERRTRMRAGLDQNGQEQTNPVFRSRLFRSYDDRTRARYRSQYLKTQADIDRASLLNDPQYMEEMRFKQDLALEGERNEIELMNDPNYRESLRANQQEALEKKQKDVQSSMLKTGKFTYTDTSGAEHTIADPSNGGALRDALVAELSKSDGDISKINALYDAIRAKGDAGIDLLGEVWDSGTLDTAGRGFAEFRDKIVADGEIKSKARTLHSVAKNVQNGSLSYSSAGNQVADARSNGVYVKDIAAEKIPDLTSNEMAALNTRAQGGDAVAQETIYRTMANPELNSKVKGNDRDSVLWSASQYLQNNFKQIDHANDRTETWRDNAGRTRLVGITPEGLRYDKQSGGNYGQALDIRQLKANWTRIS